MYRYPLSIVSLVLALLVVDRSTLHARELIEDVPAIRPIASGLVDLVTEGVERSRSFAALVDELEASDVLILVHCLKDWDARHAGRLTFMASVPNHRYLSIQIACSGTPGDGSTLTRDIQLAVFGHELQHAVEIAESVDVVDHGSMGDLFERIGVEVTAKTEPGRRRFDTSAARRAGLQILGELAVDRQRTQRLSRSFPTSPVVTAQRP